MTHVIFFRNMNLGHTGSPDRSTLERALMEAGARAVRSFQTNGTVAIEAERPPTDVVADAAPALLSRSGYRDAGVVRSVDALEKALSGDPFEAFRDDRTYRETLTFFEGGQPLVISLPWTGPKGDVDLITVDDGIALGIIRKERPSAGSPTAEIERLTGGTATTRTAGTVRRLLAALRR